MSDVPRRSPLMFFFVAAPIAMGGGLVIATIGWFAVVSGTAGTARGARVAFAVEADCAEAADVLRARAQMLGLEPEIADARLSLAMPGMPDDATHLPVALAQPGLLEIAVDGAPRRAAVREVGVQVAFSGAPVTLVMLEDALPERGVTVTIDGAPADVEEVTGSELQIAARAGQSREALRIASDRAMALRHPLPCAVRLSPVPTP